MKDGQDLEGLGKRGRQGIPDEVWSGVGSTTGKEEMEKEARRILESRQSRFLHGIS